MNYDMTLGQNGFVPDAEVIRKRFGDQCSLDQPKVVIVFGRTYDDD